MNGIATFGDEYWPGLCFFAAHNQVPACRSGCEETMTSAMTAFGMALGGTSLICYLLMTRLQNRRANRGSSGRSPAPDGGNYGGGGGGWSIFTRFGGDNSASDSSGNPGDSAGTDSGGGGDGGGGGGAGD